MSGHTGEEVVSPVERHLHEALSESDDRMKQYHIREALQLLLAEEG
ncbi:MAG: hypothetical protein ACOCQY_03540 [Halorhabdus sp.]